MKKLILKTLLYMVYSKADNEKIWDFNSKPLTDMKSVTISR